MSHKGEMIPQDADGDGKTDTVGVDQHGPDGTGRPDGIVDGPAPVYLVDDEDGNKIRVAVLGVVAPPLPKVPTLPEVLERMKSRHAGEIRQWKMQVDQYGRRIGTIGNERDKAVQRGKRATIAAWISGGFALIVPILMVLFYAKSLFFGGGEAPPLPAPTQSAATWLESVRPLLDDPGSDTDDYSRGRDALGLED